MEFTDELPASAFLRIWGGIGAISCALTRRVWLRTRFNFPPLYPNFFLLLLGDPGVGKDIAIEPAREALIEASTRFGKNTDLGICIGPKSLSAKGLVDALNTEKAKLTLRTGVNGSIQTDVFHSLSIITPELGVLFPEYNTALAAIMCDLWNCGKNFEEQTRSGKGESIFIERPHVAALFGTQPSFLGTTFPEEAYSMGFFSRTIILFEPKPYVTDLFDDPSAEVLKSQIAKHEKLWNCIVSDFQAIMELNGPFQIENAARESLNRFHKTVAEATKLKHSRYAHYNTRRSLHLSKLALLMSVAESSSKIIKLEHVHRARELLSEAESRMPLAFKNIVSSAGFHTSVEGITHGREGKIVSHRSLETWLRKRHRPAEVGLVIKSMLASGALVPYEDEEVHKSGFPKYRVMTEEEL